MIIMIYEIAQNAQKAIENDCDAYEIYIDESKSIELDSRKEELNFAKEEIECGVGIRVIKDNKVGFAFTSNMDKIVETAKQAIENTKLNKVDDNYTFAEVEKVPTVKDVYDKKFNDLSLDESIEFLKSTIDTALDSGCEVTGSGFSASAWMAAPTSRRLCGAILVAIPTAIPEVPFTIMFGSADGNTSGSSRDSS